jgi:N-acetylglucosamine kinase-like BadF-type ATPase
MTLFLGVDGGGTKTRFVVVDHDGRVTAAHETLGTDHLQLGIDGVRDVLGNGLAALFRQAGIDGSAIAHAFFGLPAYGEDSAVQPMLDALPQPLLRHRRYSCGNDMVCAWAGSLAGEDGVNIVAGTGSIGYGERRGRSARAGGWGEVFGDEGSAYWIAARGLNAFSRMSDGRLPRGRLHAAMRSSFGLRADVDLCARIARARSRSEIAAIAAVVASTAYEGDAFAVRIFDDAARELAAIVEAVAQSLHFESGERIPVSFSGGVFKAGQLIIGPFRRRIEELSAGYDVKAPLLSPAAGAALYAARLGGLPLSTAAIQRLRDAPGEST